MDVARMQCAVERPTPVLVDRNGARRIEQAHARGVGLRGAAAQGIQVANESAQVVGDAGRPMGGDYGASGPRGKASQRLYPYVQGAVPGVGNAPEAREPSSKKDSRFRIPDGDAARGGGAVLVDELEPAAGHGQSLRAPEDAVGARHARSGHDLVAEGATALGEAALAALGNEPRGRLVREHRRATVLEQGRAEDRLVHRPCKDYKGDRLAR